MAQNEVLFREVNERVNEIAHDHGRDDHMYDYLCECANSDCTFQIALTQPEYESLRADATQFAVLPLHFTPEIETLVAENERYWIVKKTGEAAELVEEADPRSQ
jgi:hypothetical protein